ncbi:MAG: molybdopterin converting factor subunit 1, partial [Burkholderiales bacterium]
LGTAVEEIELPSSVTTTDSLRLHLSKRGNSWEKALADPKLARIAVNQDMASAAAQLNPGDEVAFFPPVTGG